MDIFLKSVISFFILLLYTRILGKKQMNQITYFNYITGITLGSIAASVSVDQRISILNGVISITTWVILTFLISYIALKSYKARNLFDGEPDILIRHGKLLQDKIKKAHLNMDDLTMLLREKNIFSVSDVEFAILEPHGKLSVMKKPNLNAATKGDMNVQTNAVPLLSTDIIIDGKILRRNLEEIGRDEEWLKGELSKYGLDMCDANKIFYLSLQEDDSLYLCLKDK